MSAENHLLNWRCVCFSTLVTFVRYGPRAGKLYSGSAPTNALYYESRISGFLGPTARCYLRQILSLQTGFEVCATSHPSNLAHLRPAPAISGCQWASASHSPMLLLLRNRFPNINLSWAFVVALTYVQCFFISPGDSFLDYSDPSAQIKLWFRLLIVPR